MEVLVYLVFRLLIGLRMWMWLVLVGGVFLRYLFMVLVMMSLVLGYLVRMCG